MVPITHCRTCCSGEGSYRIKYSQHPDMFCLGKLVLRSGSPLALATLRQKLGKGYDRVHILGWQIPQDLSQPLFKGLFHHFSPWLMMISSLRHSQG